VKPSTPQRDRASTQHISFREVAAVCGVALVVAIVMTWPLLPNITKVMPGMEIGDPYLHAWQIAWEGHALETDPTTYLQANTQWPLPDALGYLDAATGYAPAGLVGEGLGAATIRYNILFLFAYWLAFVGAYLLARQLNVGVAGSLLAAAAFAFAPWRSAQNGHLLILSSGGIPLSLFFFLRSYMRGRPRLVIVGALVAAWQLSLGFGLGLQFSYLLGLLALIAGVRWWSGYGPRFDASFLRAVAVGIVIFIATGALLAIPLLRVASQHPEETQRSEELEVYSPPPSSFTVAPEHNLLWGDTAEARRDRLYSPEEQALFPGLFIVVLAVLGLLDRTTPRKVRLFLGVAALLIALLSMGVAWGPSRFLYSVMYDFGPGWRAMRTPGRLNTLTSLGLALLAGLGASLLLRLIAARSRVWVARAASCAVVLVVLIEGAGSIWSAPPAPYPDGLDTATPPILILPYGEIADRIYTFWSIEGFPDIVNGIGAVIPMETRERRVRMEAFPDAATVAELRNLGVETVVIHPSLAAGTAWADASDAPLEGLDVTREARGDVILFDLQP
jgi:hypothetical protein